MSRKRLTDADKRLIDRWTRGNPSVSRSARRLARLRGAALAKKDFAAWGKDISKRELARMREFFRATARWGYRQRDLGWMLGMHRSIRRNPTWKQKRKMSGKGFQRMLAEQAEMLTGMRFARKIRGHAAGAVEDAAARLGFVRRWTMPRRLSPEAKALLKAARELRAHRPASWGGGMFHNYVLRPRVEEARKALVAARTWRRRNPIDWAPVVASAAAAGLASYAGARAAAPRPKAKAAPKRRAPARRRGARVTIHARRVKVVKRTTKRKNPWGPFLGGMAAGAGMHVMTRALNAIQQNPKKRRRR